MPNGKEHRIDTQADNDAACLTYPTIGHVLAADSHIHTHLQRSASK